MPSLDFLQQDKNKHSMIQVTADLESSKGRLTLWLEALHKQTDEQTKAHGVEE